MLTIISWVNRGLAQIEKWTLVALSASLGLLLIVQVVLRYLFDSPLFWAEEVAVQILVAMSFLGVSYLIYRQQLVAIDFIYLMLAKPLRRLASCLFQLVALASLVLFAWLTYQWVSDPLVQSELSPTTQLPRWYNYSVLLIALMAMSFHQLVNWFESLRNLVLGEGV
ncbi:TRAP-type transport system, small permease component, predicted N-acetylneuraminate transporter [Marinobacterium lacunae]|uniref:TRAP transporter small permease protein n=1 Tax=Marinobacterium lacunae TaxID=1232683 RepID=A0A081FZF6_9GAMM|nr:TRAP transporter small permease [Marinobacterium lacunae]KEA63911.1 TRAP-type transport system, small permease component, predicted N-acetylneuraminate transporter [Marinobacterium lacunae]